MNKLSAITHDTDMTTRHAMGTEDQNIPHLYQHEGITGIPLKPNLLDLRRRRCWIGVQINAPAFAIQIPQEVPTVIVVITAPEDRIHKWEDVRNDNAIHNKTFLAKSSRNIRKTSGLCEPSLRDRGRERNPLGLHIHDGAEKIRRHLHHLEDFARAKGRRVGLLCINRPDSHLPAAIRPQ